MFLLEAHLVGETSASEPKAKREIEGMAYTGHGWDLSPGKKYLYVVPNLSQTKGFQDIECIWLGAPICKIVARRVYTFYHGGP